MRLLPIAFVLASMVSTVSAQNAPPAATAANAAATPPAPASPCAAPEFRQFDFWIGEWDVTVGGKPAGSSRVQPILDGCALLENWRGASGSEGKSFNTYNITSKRWEQYWVDGAGTPLHLTGGLVGGAMVLSQQWTGADGKVNVQRITWTHNADGSVRQHWEASSDGGKTWTTSFDGIYRKVAIASPSHT